MCVVCPLQAKAWMDEERMKERINKVGLPGVIWEGVIPKEQCFSPQKEKMLQVLKL